MRGSSSGGIAGCLQGLIGDPRELTVSLLTMGAQPSGSAAQLVRSDRLRLQLDWNSAPNSSVIRQHLAFNLNT